MAPFFVFFRVYSYTYIHIHMRDKKKKKKKRFFSMHWPGIGPGSPAWQASILPLNHQCVSFVCQQTIWIFDDEEKDKCLFLIRREKKRKEIIRLSHSEDLSFLSLHIETGFP